ncbi:hypothetical protein RUM43_001297 [Polyplax serrata]|uniref:Uncharacterized protein n=1 Tax=Polyplax serrata TaxID=468196 RepID=A0AAN8SG19_POLSC
MTSHEERERTYDGHGDDDDGGRHVLVARDGGGAGEKGRGTGEPPRDENKSVGGEASEGTEASGRPDTTIPPLPLRPPLPVFPFLIKHICSHDNGS